MSPEEQRSLRSAALAVPPLAWQQLTPQLFSLLAQGQVGTTLAPSRRLLAVQRIECTYTRWPAASLPEKGFNCWSWSGGVDLRLHTLDAAPQAFAQELAAAVLALVAGSAPSVIIFPALVASTQGGSSAHSEAMQQVLGRLKAGDGALLQGAQLLLQQLNHIACLWSEQWLHTLSDAQVCIPPMPQCTCQPPIAGGHMQ